MSIDFRKYFYICIKYFILKVLIEFIALNSRFFNRPAFEIPQLSVAFYHFSSKNAPPKRDALFFDYVTGNLSGGTRFYLCTRNKKSAVNCFFDTVLDIFQSELFSVFQNDSML